MNYGQGPVVGNALLEGHISSLYFALFFEKNLGKLSMLIARTNSMSIFIPVHHSLHTFNVFALFFSIRQPIEITIIAALGDIIIYEVQFN